MFPELKAEIELQLGIKVFPLIGPQSESEFVTLQLISDPRIESGAIRTSLAAIRYQISFVSSLYSRNEEMDNKLWAIWGDIAHGNIGDHPVQYVSRQGVIESYDQNDGGKYRRARDYIFYCRDGAAT